MASGQKYNDKKFFLIAIAFISAFNYYLTYSNIHLNWFLLLTYAIDTVQGWLAWWVVRSIIIRLDQKLPYGNQPAKRILIQIVVTTLAGMLVIIVLTELTSLIAKGHTAPVSFYLFDVFIIVIWFFVINGIYIGMHYYSEWKQSESKREADKKLRSDGFNVRHGNHDLVIPFTDILSFYVEDGYTIALTKDSKKYFPDRSLDRIETQLPEEYFFRLNRQFILNRKALTGFKRTGDGKIEVQVQGPDGFPMSIPVSRNRIAGFKSWFRDPE